MILSYHFAEIIIVLIVYSAILYYYNGRKRILFVYNAHCINFIIVVSDVWYLIVVYQLEFVSFVGIACDILSFDNICIYFKSIFTSINTIFIRL